MRMINTITSKVNAKEIHLNYIIVQHFWVCKTFERSLVVSKAAFID